MTKQERFLLTAIGAFLMDPTPESKKLLSEGLEAIIQVQVQENNHSTAMAEWANTVD